MLAGSLWAISMRWGIKLLGFISTAILARMVLPSDYAVVAMAFLVTGLIGSFFDFGVEVALIRKAEVDDAFVDSAWSLRVVEGIGIALMLALFAPLANAYFHDQRVVPVLWIFAVCTALTGSSNIGVMLARKTLNFSLEFKIQIVAKLFQVFVTVGLAYVLHDYRALVAGIVASYCCSWALSYLLHPYRPGWNTSAFREIWGVTRWLMLSNIARFMVRKADEISAGRIGTSAEFGMYNVGADLGQLPTGEIGPAILKAFFPVLSSIQHDPARVRSGVLKVMAIVNAITLPAGIGLAAVAAPATLLMLGPNWSGAIPFVAIFGLVGAAQVASIPLSTLLTMRGFTKIQSTTVWIEFTVFILASLVLVPLLRLQGLAIARLIGVLFSTMLISYQCSKYCDLPVRAVANTIWRPISAAILMFFVTHGTVEFFRHSLAGFTLAIAAGAVTYTVIMLITWYLAGKPKGLESEMFGYLENRRTKPLL